MSDEICTTLLGCLYDFQTVAVGVVGFTGVILTLVANAWIVRKQESERRDHERVVLTRAILAELRSYRESTERNVEKLSAYTSGNELHVPATRPTMIFDSNVANLGLLTEPQVRPVFDAYIQLRHLDHIMIVFGKPDDSGEFRIVDARGHTVVRVVTEELLARLEAAIVVLEEDRS